MEKNFAGTTLRAEISVFSCKNPHEVFHSYREYLESSSRHHFVFLDAKQEIEHPRVHCFDLEDYECLFHWISWTFALSSLEIYGLEDSEREHLFDLHALHSMMTGEALDTHSIVSENLYANLQHLSQSFTIGSLRNYFSHLPAVVCGSGPSLSENISLIKAMQKKALIIAAGSSLSSMGVSGIRPHCAVAIDPLLKGHDALTWQQELEVPLFYQLRVSQTALKSHQGFRFYLGEHTEVSHYFTQQAYSLDAEVSSVGGLSVVLAWYLGCNPIILCGLDSTYRIATTVEDLWEGSRTLQNNLPSSQNLIIYAKEIDLFAQKHPGTTFLNLHQGGYPFSHVHAHALETSNYPQKDIQLGPWFQTLPEVQEKLRCWHGDLNRTQKLCQHFLEGSMHEYLFEEALHQTLAYKNLLSDAEPILGRLLTRKFCESKDIHLTAAPLSIRKQIKDEVVRYFQRILQKHGNLSAPKSRFLAEQQKTF